ncbi:Bug family tripartite tricarboxylate transporter substrate binding protein [Noviherbaspirillum massiliense]|uniref:Bug family tripartite tricarboxylate transporter substrate binding protein n=1 Tax=Noviherbaspirillum massiliense TaxID=1465823 RepID=UPI0004751899|nr:tripartite tricarboxylate transporter substrate binding protein [Noviherbaspirillum massiliense]
MTTKGNMLKCAALLSLALPLVAGSAFAADWKPTKSVEFVVPSGAGGGTDQFARLVQSIIVKHKLMDQNIVVLNKGGGSGAEGFFDAATDKGNAHKIVFGTNNAYLLPMVLKVPYKFDQLTPVAMMAQDEFLIWVQSDAPYKTAKEYLDAVKANPSNFKMGGSQSKDTDQTLVELINMTHNIKLTYIPFKSGGEAATQLAGKHVTSNVNNPNENISQWRAGQVKPLCVFSPERMKYHDKVTAEAGWSDIPTCKEQGVNIDEYRMPRTVYMPAGVKPEQVSYYVNLLKKVSETPEWKSYLQTNGLNDNFASGDAFRKYITKDEETAHRIFSDAGWLLK